jgi:hypothetical protein
MLKSKHTQIRCQQRGIPQEVMSLIIEHGQELRRPGGAREYRLLKKNKDLLISALKKQIHLIERSAGKGVLVSSDLNTVITTYHLTKKK